IPDYLGHADNYIPANPAVTPTHIVPEWYYLPFYAILRAIPNKLLGVMALGALPADLPAMLLAVRRVLHRPRLPRFAGAGGRLCHRGAHSDALLLRVLRGHPAAARHFRENQAAA